MTTLTIIIALILCSPELMEDLYYPNPSAVDIGNWKLVKSADGVQTYVRWTTNSEGKTARERKGEMNVDCSVQDAVRLITDVESTGKWMSGVSENYFISHIDQTEWYTYTLFSIPWPFNKRDLVSLFKVNSDPSLANVSIAIVSKDKYVPLKSGITRLIDYRAIWVITRLEAKKTKISFNVISTAPLIFPRPIQDPVIERVFHNNLVRLRETLSI